MKVFFRIAFLVFLGLCNQITGLAGNPFNLNYCYLNYIHIEGETNISSFNLVYNNDESLHQNSIELHKPNEIVEFKIPVYQFKGKNSLMEKDFRDLLDATNYPLIKVGINENCLDKLNGKIEEQKIEFYLTIAGETKKVVGYYKPLYKNDQIVVKGVTKIKLTDFSIEPPEKMFGMLQVKDSIIIKFDIILLSKSS